MRSHRCVSVLALLSLLFCGLFTAVPGAGADVAQAEACFVETGFCVRGRFLDSWQASGGLAINGYPLGAERRELLEDGNEYIVQYFERVRLEHHPEHAPPFDVLRGHFGRRVLRVTVSGSAFRTDPTTPRPDMAYFPETGHNVGERFLAYWQANGGLPQFGYPLTEEFEEQLNPDSSLVAYRVQYFERARFEYHPENDSPYDVLLGHFGRRILAESDALVGDRGFQRLYLTSEHLQEQVGRPIVPAVRAAGGYRGFERGAMLWRGDTREISVLCGGNRRAGDDVRGPFADTWREGEAPGGGPGPRPGLYEPGRGFGKLWLENAEVRDCLGYSTDSAETAYTLTAQPFRRQSFDNLLVSAETPEGAFIYAVYRNFLGSSSCISRPSLCRPDYERYPNPAP